MPANPTAPPLPATPSPSLQEEPSTAQQPNYQRVSDFAQNIHAPNWRDTDLTGDKFNAVDAMPPLNNSVAPRDFLTAPAAAEGSGILPLAALMAEQNDVLQDIAAYLRRRVPDVLCTAVARGTGSNNSIVTPNATQVLFEVGGKPVPIFRLLAFSTWTGVLVLSILSMANAKDGIPMVAGTPIVLDIPIDGGVWVSSATASFAQPLIVNGPADPTNGGVFLYGFTIPDYDRIRGGTRSMQG